MPGDDVSEERPEERPERLKRPSRARFRVIDFATDFFVASVRFPLRRLFKVTLKRRVRFA